MEFPITIKDGVVYFRVRYDSNQGGASQVIIDPEAMFRPRGLIIPLSYRSLGLIDAIEQGRFAHHPLIESSCIVIDHNMEVRHVMCVSHSKIYETDRDWELVHVRILIGQHTQFVIGDDEQMLNPQLIAAMAAGLTPTEAYEELAMMHNITDPYLVQFPLAYIQKRLRELNYTESVLDGVKVTEVQKDMNKK